MPTSTWGTHGPDVVLSGGSLTCDCVGNQECVRSSLGRDPARGGVFMAEFVVAGSGTGSDRPMFGICNASYNIAAAAGLGYADNNAWAFYTGVVGLQANGQFHNGSVGGNWDPGGGGTGGLATTYQLVYDAGNKTLKLYRLGVLQNFSFTGVGANGVLMYLAFGSGSAPATHELCTANFGATPFAFPIAGTIPWNTDPGSSANFFRLFR